MSLKIEGLSCPVCHAYLFEEDDVVFCPECGAPHHRECYSAVGHCALAGLHGTDKQYDREEQFKKATIKAQQGAPKTEPFVSSGNEGTRSCGMCHERYDITLNACPNCGAPNMEKFGEGFDGFDFLGGIPADYDIGEGVTADEAKKFVITNTHRYIPKFARLSKMSKASWNWMAFLFPGGWLLARKMYKAGVIISVILVAAAILVMPLSSLLYDLTPVETVQYADMMQYVYDILPKIDSGVLMAAVIGMIAEAVLRFVLAIFGDYFYKSYAVNSIKEIKEKSDDKDYDFRKKGGVNIVAMMVGILALNYLPMIIMSLVI